MLVGAEADTEPLTCFQGRWSGSGCEGGSDPGFSLNLQHSGNVFSLKGWCARGVCSASKPRAPAEVRVCTSPEVTDNFDVGIWSFLFLL